MATSQPAKSRYWPLKLGGTPVLLYHGLTTQVVPECPLRERKYWISEKQFREHLTLIRAASYQVIRLIDLACRETGAPDNNKTIVISFDDGLASDYEIAFPLLLATGIQAEFFINPAEVGRKGFLTWAQVTEMHNAGMSIQSHSFEHVDLVRISAQERERQLKLSKSILEDKLGRRVDFLSVPYGRTSKEVVESALTAGYRGVCTSGNWPAQPNSLVISRAAVYSGMTPRAVERLLAGNLFSYASRMARAAALHIPKLVFSCLTRPQDHNVVSGNAI